MVASREGASFDSASLRSGRTGREGSLREQSHPWLDGSEFSQGGTHVTRRPCGHVGFPRVRRSVERTRRQGRGVRTGGNPGRGRRGHRLVRGVVEAERVLAASWWASLRGWSPGNYWLAFFGAPGAGQDWNWQFGGHHLAVNVAVRDGVMSMSPSFIGIEPATFELDGTEWAPLADHVARGAALVKALPERQRQAPRSAAAPGNCTRGPAGTDSSHLWKEAASATGRRPGNGNSWT